MVVGTKQKMDSDMFMLACSSAVIVVDVTA
jgi:hypothetical protein